MLRFLPKGRLTRGCRRAAGPPPGTRDASEAETERKVSPSPRAGPTHRAGRAHPPAKRRYFDTLMRCIRPSTSSAVGHFCAEVGQSKVGSGCGARASKSRPLAAHVAAAPSTLLRLVPSSRLRQAARACSSNPRLLLRANAQGRVARHARAPFVALALAAPRPPDASRLQTPPPLGQTDRLTCTYDGNALLPSSFSLPFHCAYRSTDPSSCSLSARSPSSRSSHQRQPSRRDKKCSSSVRSSCRATRPPSASPVTSAIACRHESSRSSPTRTRRPLSSLGTIATRITTHRLPAFRSS
jgi:hypothetical protein